ncbi:MAG: hypothetical protein ACFFH0_07545 [Promethearchaeota archaeon]
MRTSEPGVFVRKIPRSKNEPAYLAVEINPIGQGGIPMYKVGALIKDQNELDAIREIISQKKVDELLQTVQNVNLQQTD